LSTALNRSGEVVGSSTTSTGDQHAFAWTQAGGMIDLGTLPGATYNRANAVNDAGQVVGLSGNHAVLWSMAAPPASMLGEALNSGSATGASGLTSGTVTCNED